MSKQYQVDKEQCIGCGLCAATCIGGTEMEADGKAKVIDNEKLDACGGEKVCPYDAIKEI